MGNGTQLQKKIQKGEWGRFVVKREIAECPFDSRRESAREGGGSPMGRD